MMFLSGSSHSRLTVLGDADSLRSAAAPAAAALLSKAHLTPYTTK